jgi:methionine synthase II (cobalamin-independent)
VRRQDARSGARTRGDEPNELPHRYATFINRVVAQKPAGMTLAVHLCRGNFKSTRAQGGYEPVAEALLAEMKVDGYFLSTTIARSGDFAAAFRRRARRSLGLITTKLGRLESKDDISAASTSREVRAARAALPVAAVRLLEHGARQRHRGRGTAREAAPGRRSGARGVGLNRQR